MEENNFKHTELSALGEFGLIAHLTGDIVTVNPETIKGIGDDAAVLDAGNRVLLLSSDILAEGIHFDLSYTPLKHLGYKAAVVNFSDICAMNGLPAQLLVSMAVSNRFPVEALEEIYEGIRLACKKYKVDLVGGDTTSSAGGLFLSLAVTGYAEREKVVYRSGASDHELICVSGDLGAAYMGLLLLEREKKVFEANPQMQPDLDGHDYILERQLKPEARADIVKLLAENGILPTSMIDISDGLASEILHICTASGTGCMLYHDKFPMDAATLNVCDEFSIDPVTAALNGGEDYELLFTIRQSDYEKIKMLPAVAIIGHITDENSGVNLVSPNGVMTEIKAQGWDALRKK